MATSARSTGRALTLAAASLGLAATIAAGATLLAGAAAALLGAEPGTTYLRLLGPFVALGFGLGLIVPVMTAAMLSAVDRSRSGIAAGVLNGARQTGSLIGVALYGALIAGGRLVSGLHVALAISVALAFGVAVAGTHVRG